MERPPLPERYFRDISPDKHPDLKGSGNKIINEMLQNPEHFYVPPTDKDLEEREGNRRKRDKIKKYFRQLIDSHILTTAVIGHEQMLEINKAKKLGLDQEEPDAARDLRKDKNKKNKLDSARDLLLQGEDIEKVESIEEIEPGTLEKIIKNVENQPDILETLQDEINERRESLLDKAIERVQEDERQFFDPLTGGASKIGVEVGYQDLMEKNIDQEHNIVFVNFDINSFKLINDEFGHPKGDEILKNIIKALNEKLRGVTNPRSEDVIGRTGGDEFTVIGRVRKGDEQRFLDKIKTAVESVDNPLGGKVTITGGAFLVGDKAITFEIANELSDEAGIFQKIKAGNDILIYTPDLKPDLTTKDKRKGWAEAWVNRQAKREREKKMAEFNASENPAIRAKIAQELKLLEEEIEKRKRRKESELERQANKEEKKKKTS
jgi:diguanylate cyclase (GGDEF)-like protein